MERNYQKQYIFLSIFLLSLITITFCTDTCSDGYYSRTGVSTFICSACDTSCFTCSGFGTSNCLTCPGRIETPGDTPSGKCITGCAGGEYVGWDSICTDVATLSAEFTALALDPANTTNVFRKAAWLANSIRDASAQTRQQTVIEKVTDATCAIYKAQEGFNVLATVTNIYGSYTELNQASVTALSTHLLTTMTSTEFSAITSMEYFRILLTVYQNAIVQFAKAKENGLTITATEQDGLLEQKELIKQNMVSFMAGNGTDSELSSTEYISLNYYIGANSQLTIAKFESTTTAEEIKFERQTNENFFVFLNTEGATQIIPTVATTITYLALDFYDNQPYDTLYPTPVTTSGSINASPGLGLKFYQFLSGVLDSTTYGISTAIPFSNTDSDVQNFTIQLPSVLLFTFQLKQNQDDFASSYLPVCEMRDVSANGWVECGTDYHYSITQVNSGVQISMAKYQVTPISKAFFISISTQCPQGYFLNAEIECEECPSSCLACSSATQCTRCNYAFEVPASAPLCTCTTAGEFADYGTGLCQVATDVSGDDFTLIATLADLKTKTKQAIDSANGAKQTDAAAKLQALATALTDLEIICNIISLLGTSETLEAGAVPSMVATLEAMIALATNIFDDAIMTQDLAELVFASANAIVRQANLLDSTKIISAWTDFQQLIELYIKSQWMIADTTLQTWTTAASNSYSLLPRFIKLFNGDMLGFFFINKNSQIPCDKVAIDFGSVQLWFPLKDFLYLRTYRGAIGAFSFHATANNPFKGYTTTAPALDPQVTIVPTLNVQLWGAKETDETPPSTPTWENINEPFIEAKIYFEHSDTDANIEYFCNSFDFQDETLDTDNYWTIERRVYTEEQSLTGLTCSSHYISALFSVRQNDCSQECKTCVGFATSDEKQQCLSCVVGKVLVPHSTLTGFFTCKNEASLLASDTFIVGEDVRIRNADADLCLGVTEVSGAAGVKQWVDCEAATYKYNTILWTVSANTVDPTKYDLTNKYDSVNAFGSPNVLTKVDYLMANQGDSQYQQLIQRFAQLQNVDTGDCYYYDATSILLEQTCNPVDVTNATNPWATATWNKIMWFEYMHSFDFRGNEINYDTPVIQQNAKSENLDSMLFGFPSVASGIKQNYNIEYIFAKELNIDASISDYPTVTTADPGYTCSSFNPFSNILFEMSGTKPAEQITSIISLQDLLDCGFQKVDHSVVGYLIERDHDENAIFYYKLTVTYESAITVEGQIETDAQITEVIIKRGDDLTEQLQVFVPSVYLIDLLQGQLESDVPLLVDLELGRVFDIKVALPEGIESSFSFALTRLDSGTSTYEVAEMSNMFTSFEVPLTLISGQPSSDGNVYYVQVEIPTGASYPDGQYLFETDAALTLLTSRRLLEDETELVSTAQLSQSFKFSTGEDTTDTTSEEESKNFKITLIFILCGILALLLFAGSVTCFILRRKLHQEEAKIKKAVQLSNIAQQQNDTMGVAGMDSKLETQHDKYAFPQNQSQSEDANKEGLVELDLDDI